MNSESVLLDGEGLIIPTTTTREREDARRSVDTGEDLLDVKDGSSTTGNGAVDGTSVSTTNETVSTTKNVPPTKMDSTTTNASPLDVSSLDSQSTTEERRLALDEKPSSLLRSNHAQSPNNVPPAMKNDPPRLLSDEPNSPLNASTMNNSQSTSTNTADTSSTIPSTSPSIPPSTSTSTPTSQNSPPDVDPSPSPSQPPIDAPTQPSIKIIDFGYAASSPLHRPLWAPPLDEHEEEEEFEEFDDDSDSDDEDEADEEEEAYGEGEGEEEGDSELEPGLYRAVYAFEAEGASEVSLERGQVVRVVGRGGGVGWAVVLDEGGKEGKRRHALVPESYLVRVEEGQE